VRGRERGVSTIRTHEEFARNKLVAIGVGVIVGAAAGSYFFMLRGSLVLGAVAGGLIADWWYRPPERVDMPRLN
jgi:hypothetical protein